MILIIITIKMMIMMGHLVKRNGHRTILAIVRLLETRAVVEVFLAVHLQSVQLCCVLCAVCNCAVTTMRSKNFTK